MPPSQGGHVDSNSTEAIIEKFGNIFKENKMITKREAAIITAHTGIMLGSFSDFHEYVEYIMGRPIWTHEMGRKEIANKIKQLSKNDFIHLNVNLTTK